MIHRQQLWLEERRIDQGLPGEGTHTKHTHNAVFKTLDVPNGKTNAGFPSTAMPETRSTGHLASRSSTVVSASDVFPVQGSHELGAASSAIQAEHR